MDKKGKPITVGPDGRPANPFDMGSGFLNPTQVLDPGLVYDATVADYKDFLCSIGYSDKQLQLITKDNSTCNPNRRIKAASDLNYPSITVPNLAKSYSVSRTVTNVGSPESVYEAVVVPPKGVKVTVVPQRLVFNSSVRKINFTVTFEVAAPSRDYSFGSLSWRNGRSLVTTPLVLRTVRAKSGLWI